MRPAVRSGTDCADVSATELANSEVSVYTLMILLGQESRARPAPRFDLPRSVRLPEAAARSSRIEGGIKMPRFVSRDGLNRTSHYESVWASSICLVGWPL